MRFASAVFDEFKDELLNIEDYTGLETFLDRLNLPQRFIRYAASQDKIMAKPGEWEKTEPYLMPQIRALVARYSKLGDNAFYKMYLPIDEAIKIALASPFTVAQ